MKLNTIAPLLVAAADITSALPSSHAFHARAAAPALNDLIKAKGKTYFGTASDFVGNPGEATDTGYQQLLNNTALFGQQTPGNAMKWQFTEPTQNEFDYAQSDAFVAYAKANNQLIRCHNLVWNSQLPSFITSRTWTPADNDTLQAIMKNHITNLVTHYKDDCYAWDVVNEPLNDGDGSFKAGPFLSAIGTGYVALAFQFAQEAVAATGKDIKLYVNEYNNEYAGAKATALMNLVSDIKARGIQIDGVGFESHFIEGETPSRADQAAVKQQFAALGVDVAVTELDVRFSSLPPTDAQLAQQATDYDNSVGSCLDTPECVGVTVWDFDDEYSWIPGTFSGSGEADLYNADLTAKPVVDSLATLLA